MTDRNSAEISQEISNKEKELTIALQNEHNVEQEILLLQRKILDLQGKKKDLEIFNSKAKHLVRKINIEIKLLTKEFWSTKNAGL